MLVSQIFTNLCFQANQWQWARVVKLRWVWPLCRWHHVTPRLPHPQPRPSHGQPGPGGHGHLCEGAASPPGHLPWTSQVHHSNQGKWQLLLNLKFVKKQSRAIHNSMHFNYFLITFSPGPCNVQLWVGRWGGSYSLPGTRYRKLVRKIKNIFPFIWQPPCL